MFFRLVYYLISISLLIILNGTVLAAANSLTLAVSANFCHPLKDIVRQYQKSHHVEIKVVCASTTVLYQQIISGAPYDLFFAADDLHARLLLQKKHIAKANFFQYARGNLWLYSRSKLHEPTLQESLIDRCQHGDFSIANPNFSPYGIASKQALSSLKIWPQLNECAVRSNNISGVASYLQSGEVSIGFISNSEIRTLPKPAVLWRIPTDLYKPIIQAAVVLHPNNKFSESFKHYLLSLTATLILNKYDYQPPYA